ncbi:MAG: histidine kinase [Actinomycetota bacterium]
MTAYLLDQRRFNAMVLAMAVTAYFVAFIDITNRAWIPLLIPLAGFAARVVEPRLPAWPVLGLTVIVVVATNVGTLSAEGGFFLVCMAAFATTAERTKPFPDLLVVVCGVLAPVPVVFTDIPVGSWQWPFWSMGTLVSAAFGTVLLYQRRLTTELAEAQERLATQAAGEERRRIAREVHDLVGHSLTVVLLHVTGARRLVRRDPDEAESALADAERVGRGALADIRRTVALLREEGEGRAPTPTAEDLETLIAESRSAGMTIDAAVPAAVTALDETTGLVVYRIVQEALANAARHAPGARTDVRIELTPESVGIEIRNERAIRPPQPGDEGGSGLLGMEERASALGGTLLAGPHGTGWRVRAMLPRTTAPDLEPTP